MTSTLRRGTVIVVGAILIALAAVTLIETGIAIGYRGSTLSTAATASADPAAIATGDDLALVADVGALVASDPAGAPVTAAPAASANPGRTVAGAKALRRLVALRKLVHATVTIDAPRLGGLTTVQLDHGTISAVNPTSLTISEKGSSTVTVGLGDETRVRKDGDRAELGDLKAGDEVLAMSLVKPGGTEAYLVVVPAG